MGYGVTAGTRFQGAREKDDAVESGRVPVAGQKTLRQGQRTVRQEHQSEFAPWQAVGTLAVRREDLATTARKTIGCSHITRD